MAEKSNTKNAERSKWAVTYDRYQAAKAALHVATFTDGSEDDVEWNLLYGAYSDALDLAMFTPADTPFAIARKIEIFTENEMENWRNGKAALAMIAGDAEYFGSNGWQPDCG